MDKMKMHSPNKVDENIEKIGKLFPDCVTERKNEKGETEYAIDFDVLRQELSDVVVEGNEERYQFTWPDKKKSILLANAPIAKTLRPCREESVDFDHTENLYIEGDNLEVLKLLQETYLGRVKMIYIDPPYNTGNDFVYEDDFRMESGEWSLKSGDFDETGNRLVKNLDSNGRYHTDWLNMIYPRLKLAKDLLADDGVIFISIDDNEQANLKKVCDEIFGESNFIAELIWERAYAPKNDAKFISNSHDYILMYAKNISIFQIGRLDRTEEANARYSNPDNDPRGVWKPSDMSVKTYNASSDYPITTPSGRIIEPPAGRCWRLSKNAFFERLHDNRIWFGSDGNSVPSIKRFLSELRFDGMAPTSILFYKEVGHSQEGAKEVKQLFDDNGYFDGPKPLRLMRRLLTLANLEEKDIVLDFFSGSSSLAHAVLQLNADENTSRKFVMVQIPEQCDKNKDAYKSGYKNICEIGKERIRRAAAKIQSEMSSVESGADGKIGVSSAGNEEQRGLFDENPTLHTPNSKLNIAGSNLDIGFRVLKLDSTNMKDVYYNPAEYDANLFDKLTDNIKEDRTPEDLLFQVMLDLGILLSSEIEESVIAGKKVFNVADNYLITCFDDDVTDETVKAIAQQKPYYAVFRDSSMESDSVATNFEQIFKTYSPTTIRKVL